MTRDSPTIVPNSSYAYIGHSKISARIPRDLMHSSAAFDLHTTILCPLTNGARLETPNYPKHDYNVMEFCNRLYLSQNRGTYFLIQIAIQHRDLMNMSNLCNPHPNLDFILNGNKR